MEYNITYRKKDKGWQFIISYKDESGKWKQKSKQGFNQKKDAKPVAEEMLKNLRDSFNNEKQIINKEYISITFKELCDIFLEHKTLYKEHNTVKTYKSAIHNFNTLNDSYVKDIKKVDIIKCLDEMAKRLKYTSIKKYVNMTKAILDYYIENYDPNYSTPFYKIKIPVDKAETIKTALTELQLSNLLKQLKKTNKYYIVAYLAASCGLRCGEILGLRWSDINKENMTIKVSQQWKVSKKTHKSGFGNLKSNNSYRSVPISKNILKELERYKNKSTIVNINNRVAPFSKTQIDRYLNPELRKIAGISIHELRHTYATLLIANGIDFKTAAKILGHSAKMTLMTYSHVTDDMMKKASEKIGKIF